MSFLLNILYYLHHQPSLRQQGMVKEVASQLRLCKMGETHPVRRLVVSVVRRSSKWKNIEQSGKHVQKWQACIPWGQRDRPGSPREGQSKLDTHSWWYFILCSNFCRKPCSAFQTVLYIGSAISSKTKVFWVIVENFKMCMCRLFISHKETGFFLTSGVSCHVVIGSVVKYKWSRSHPGDRLSAFWAFRNLVCLRLFALAEFLFFIPSILTSTLRHCVPEVCHCSAL